jgi:hypothetical protein
VIEPCLGRVSHHFVVFVGLRYIIAEVEVGMKFGEEMERVIELKVTVGAQHFGVIVDIHKLCHRVDSRVGVEDHTVVLIGYVVPGCIAVEKVLLTTVA